MKYLVEVFWSDADEGYIAIAPDLPSCSAFGDTPEEAVHEMHDAMLSWLEACANMGRPLPRTARQATKSGGMTVRRFAGVNTPFFCQLERKGPAPNIHLLTIGSGTVIEVILDAPAESRG